MTMPTQENLYDCTGCGERKPKDRFHDNAAMPGLCTDCDKLMRGDDSGASDKPGSVTPDSCAALVAKWRSHAETIDSMEPLSKQCGSAINTMRKHAANAFRACANELEQAMRHNDQAQPSPLAEAHGSTFRAGTGLMGSTEPGQRVTQRNVRQLPAGSVVRLDGGGRLIHLHDEVWLYCSDCAHAYNGIENLKWRLPGELCHLPPNDQAQRPAQDSAR